MRGLLPFLRYKAVSQLPAMRSKAIPSDRSESIEIDYLPKHDNSFPGLGTLLNEPR